MSSAINFSSVGNLAGFIGTEPVTYALTIGATTTPPTKGTIVTDIADWCRIGPNMLINYNYVQSTGSGNAGSGNYLFPLPSGYAIDTTKLVPDTTNMEMGVCGQGGIYNGQGAWVKAYNSTNLMVTFMQSGSLVPLSSSAGALTTANMKLSFTALVPISGWTAGGVTPGTGGGANKGIYNGYFTSAAQWTNSTSGTTFVDWTNAGTATLTDLYKFGFVTVTGAASSLPGLAFTAPASGTIKVTFNCHLGISSGAGEPSVKLLESTTSTTLGYGSCYFNFTNWSITTPIVGYLNVTSGVAYNIKLLGNTGNGGVVHITVHETNDVTPLSMTLEYVI